MTLDLKDEAELIKEYDEHHKAVCREAIDSIKGEGITDMEMYRLDTRLLR